MSIQTNNHRPLVKTALLTVLVLCLARLPVKAEVPTFEFTTSNGLRIKIIQDSEMLFIHSQLLVFADIDNRYFSSAAIFYLTLLNMFDREIDTPESGLLSSLRRMGNDYQLELKPEYCKISLNFLPDRTSRFLQFLNEIFTYNSFHLKKFNRSKERYWKYFFQNRDWRKTLAYQIAYSQFFPNWHIGQTVVPQEQLKKINLGLIRSFHSQIFRPNNALLVIKGNLNPYVTLGLIEKELQLVRPANRPESQRGEGKNGRLVANNHRKTYLVNVNDNDLPSLYMFDIAPSFAEPDFIPYFIINYTLFHYPTGRLYQADHGHAGGNGLVRYQLNNEFTNQKGVAVLCSYSRINPDDIESFLSLIEQEKRKLGVYAIERKDFLEALNYFWGKLKTNSGLVENDVDIEISKALVESKKDFYPSPPEVVQYVSLEKIETVAEDYFALRTRSANRDRGIVVIIGNADRIQRQLRYLKPEIINLE